MNPFQIKNKERTDYKLPKTRIFNAAVVPSGTKKGLRV
jgi:hypothetical protein